MRTSKSRALELIDEKISQFQRLLAEATYDNRHNEGYKLAYHGTEHLLTELFSEEDAKRFRINVTSPVVGVIGGRIDYAKELARYKKHINSCIAQLRVFREKIQNFWSDELANEKKKNIVPFVAMSFDDSDQEINEYVLGILKALRIHFETGQRYSEESIPQKVQNRIRRCDIFIAIFVRRDELRDGQFTTPAWLVKEAGMALEAGKGVIALVEEGIKDIGGLNLEKELILFDRNDIKKMHKATIKLLEALKEHGLI